VTGAGTLGCVPVPVLPALRARFGALVRELSKFGAVGTVAFAIDLALFNLLLQTGTESLAAKTISTVIATTVAFLGNRFWTWRHGEHTNMARQYTMFFLLNAVGLGIGLSCLAISHYGLGQFWPQLRSPLADNVSGLLVGTALGTLFRFWSYRRFVFGATTLGVQPETGLGTPAHPLPPATDTPPSASTATPPAAPRM
jgi:putative flippase GtrA